MASLVCDPWCLSIAQIADLTDYQIYEIYYHARNEQGEIKMDTRVMAEDTLQSPEEVYKALMLFGQGFGMKPEELQDVWDKRGRSGR